MRPLPSFGLLLVLLVPLAARAEGDAHALRLDGATVLASPGVPAALDAFLPGGTRPARLAWPLPEGPLVVLGLPEQDPIARRICDVFHFDVDDLRGGYALWAWRAGRDAMVFVMGADPAALHAARFEFDADAPAEMMAPDMRSLDFRRPNQEAAVVVRAGTRRVLPRYGIRLWAPGTYGRADDPLAAAGAHVNRMLVEIQDATPDRLRALRRQGVTPVVGGRVVDFLDDRNARNFGGVLQALQRAPRSVRHFFLGFETQHPDNRPPHDRRAAAEAAYVRVVADTLRPGGLEELLVVPLCHSDRLARTVAPPPDLRDIPEALIGWSGPSEHAIRITRRDAERRVREAGIPVFLVETWAGTRWRGRDPSHVPTLPRGRAEDLHEVLAGVMVVGRDQTEPLLESAWRPQRGHRLGLELLAPLLPARGDDPRAFAGALAATLRTADKTNLGLVPWMAPMADALDGASWAHAAAVPVVPQVIAADGRITERSWGFARPLVGTGPAEVLVLSDGNALRFAVRIAKAAVGDTPFLGQLALEAPRRSSRWHVQITGQGVRIDSSGREGVPPLEPGHVHAAWRESPTHYTAEITFDRFALGGEPHPGRLFDCGVSWGPANLWPAGPANGVMGTLLVTR